jgi:hypothetical protein
MKSSLKKQQTTNKTPKENNNKKSPKNTTPPNTKQTKSKNFTQRESAAQVPARDWGLKSKPGLIRSILTLHFRRVNGVHQV